MPEGAHVIYPGHGARPCVPGKPASWCSPAHPASLHEMWPQAVETEAFQRPWARAPAKQQTLRLFGIPESEIAETRRGRG